MLKTCDSVSRFLGGCSTEEIFRKFRKSFAKCIIAIKALCQMKRQPPKSFVEASLSSWSSSSFGSSFAGRSVLEASSSMHFNSSCVRMWGHSVKFWVNWVSPCSHIFTMLLQWPKCKLVCFTGTVIQLWTVLSWS